MEKLLNEFKRLLEACKAEGVLTDSQSAEFFKNMSTVAESTKQKIADEAVKTLDEEYARELEKIAAKMDEKTVKFVEGVVGKIDEDFCDKLERLVEAFDDDFSKRIIELKKFYENKKTEEIDAYLKYAISEKFKELGGLDYAKLKRYEKLIENVRKQLVVSDDFVHAEISEAVVEAEEIINKQNKELNALKKKNTMLESKFNKIEATKLLEKKLQTVGPKTRAFLSNQFKNSTKEEIEDQFNEAAKAFELDEQQRIVEARAKAAATPVLVPKIVLEQKNEQKEDSVVEQYVTMLNKNKFIKE